MKYAIHTVILFSFAFLFNTAYTASNSYQDQNPYFYVVLAEASYCKSKREAQQLINKLLGGNAGTVIKFKEFNTWMSYGTTNIILFKDNHNKNHVAFKGSSSVDNWIGNIAMPIRGCFAEYDVPPRVRDGMHGVVHDWKKKHGTITTMSGHSQGGMYASQVAASHKKHYKETTIITFNAYKPKKKENQLHFAISTEHASTLFSPTKRYIQVNKGGAHWKIVSNHRMNVFLQGLKDKSWNSIL